MFGSGEDVAMGVLTGVFTYILPLDHFKLSLDRGIPMVFDSIISAARKPLRYECPSVAQSKPKPKRYFL